MENSSSIQKSVSFKNKPLIHQKRASTSKGWILWKILTMKPPSFIYQWRKNKLILKDPWKILKILRKESKSLISIKNITTTIFHSIEFYNKTITHPTAISVFNSYLTSIPENTKSNIKFSPKHYTEYLTNTNANAFFLTPSD